MILQTDALRKRMDALQKAYVTLSAKERKEVDGQIILDLITKTARLYSEEVERVRIELKHKND